ncbi:MAG: molybdenum cofactor guanylyltransferase [Flavobacteriales bacterium]|nr:MAG: molybdenum cofactor guanylyltransferase [Flavobacteriales bacterium]
MISNAKIFGLVLSGGKSSRMGTDKGLIDYHGMPQREFLYHMLDQICERTFISIRADQTADIPSDMAVIVDEDQVKGPYNGLLSAHHQFPEVAWLVLACDLPLIDLEALNALLAERRPEMMATAFALKENPLPEPLCAIWEPRALQRSVSFLETGKGSCPRKFLINNPVHLVFPKNEKVLLNANSRAEYLEALNKLSTA